MSSVSVASKSTGSDVITNLANLLPTGTFLAFQAIAPLFTNNGECENVEKIMTGILVLLFSIIIVVLSYTDSITLTTGKHYYGIVTPWGLFSPQFEALKIPGETGNFYKGTDLAGNSKFVVTRYDFINSILSVMVFGGLVLLTPPVSDCYFPSIPSTISKTIPILLAIVAGMYFSFAPRPRKGVGYSITGLVESAGAGETLMNTHTETMELSTPNLTINRRAEDTSTSSAAPASTSAATTAGARSLPV